MAKKLLATLLLMSLLLAGCAYGTGEDDSYAVVYRISNTSGGGGMLVRETVAYSPGEEAAQVMLARLNSTPEIVGLERVFPEGVRAHSCSIENGMATVGMSDEFAQLSEMEQLICSSALTLTFCTLDEVCAVNVECAGEVYIRELRPEDIQFADPIFESHERTAKLFLPAADTDKLTPCSRDLRISEAESMEELVAQAVLDSLPVYTERAKVLSAQISEGICTLDLSEAFYGNEPADSVEGMLIIYSLVNSLCRLNNVDSLIICVEGQTVVSYGGYRASWPLSPRDSLIMY